MVDLTDTTDFGEPTTTTLTRECSGCGAETAQPIRDIKYDGSGFTRCPRCEKSIVHMAGTFGDAHREAPPAATFTDGAGD